jgi:hypothetical protein
MSNDNITMPIDGNLQYSYVSKTSFILPKYDGYWVI